ncbi:MAG: dicarboxylate transporter subunit DctP [Betaproteobacteria bacterium]|nr:dicarboxylate transporter subunit DctP [Betaproteobacteria bacterium]
MMFRRFSIFPLAGLLAALLAVNVHAEDLVGKIGLSLDGKHPQGMGLQKFADLAKQKTSGRVSFRLFPNGSLGNDIQMTTALQAGTLEVTLPASSTVANLVKEIGLFDLPFLFNSPQEADAVLDGPIGQRILAKLPEKGLIGLAWMENGYFTTTNSKHPITKLEDFQGLKLRAIQNPIYVDTTNALGAIATPLPVTEVYTALETKAIDGQQTPTLAAMGFKFFDVQKYLSLTNHTYNPFILIMSKKFWDKLSPADQKAVQAAANEARDYERTQSRALNTGVLADVKAKGIVVNELAPAEVARMRERVKPVVEKHVKLIGEPLYKEMMAQLTKIRGGK